MTIAFFGAGSIGCHVGGMLAAAGSPVTLIGRKSMGQALASGMQVAAFGQAPIPVAPDQFSFSETPSALADARLILVCVKSADTREAADAIAAHAPSDTTVISLQNGVINAALLGEALGQHRVSAGMVAYNVVRPQPNHFVQATEGAIYADAKGAALVNALAHTPLEASVQANMTGVQWSKMLLNLNNALNLLSGRGLRDELMDRRWRRVFAACVREAITVADAHQVRLERIGKVPPRWLPTLLELPDFIFHRAARSMLDIDPEATTSMVDDYRRGRPSEVDWLNGAIADHAEAANLKAPVNAMICCRVRDAFADPERPALANDPEVLLQSAIIR